jgi:hypothetical protein
MGVTLYVPPGTTVHYGGMPRPTPGIGTLIGVPLPHLGKLAPFSADGYSKHTNMASDGQRVYVSGGDWEHSATDGTWSAPVGDLSAWRQDLGVPVYPTLPAPHALQDGAGFVWVEDAQRFLLWPGSYFAYEAVDAPIRNYSRGMWWFDPATNTYEQDLRLFGAAGSTTGCPYGGVLDDSTMTIIAFGDGIVARWDVQTGRRLSDVPVRLVRDPAAPAAYYRRTQPVRIGRSVYALGVRTDGASVRKPLMIRYDLDAQAVTECAPAPVGPRGPTPDIETRCAVSSGKLVWPRVYGPEGDIEGIAVYDPETDSWAVDEQMPSDGNYIANSLCSLPDGRVVMCGGVFGKRPTHLWTYEVVA